MARLVYGCRFRVPSASLEDVLSAYEEWIVDHYRTRRNIADFVCHLAGDLPVNVPDGHDLRRNLHSSNECRALVADWNYPDDRDKSLRWRNAIRLATFDSSASIEHAVYLESIEHKVAPAQFSFGSPTVIRKLCADRAVYVGQMRIQATVYRLEANGVSDFLALLTNPLRRLPLVLVTPYANGDGNLIDPSRLAKRLAGVAVVVDAIDSDATWSLADELGRTLSCFDGGVRIYWPGFSLESDPRSAPLYLGQNIGLIGAPRTVGTIERLIFSVSSFRFSADPKISEIVRASEQLKRAVDLEAHRATQAINWEQYALELDAELQQERERVGALEAEIENLRANQNVFFDQFAIEPEDVRSDQIEVPNSVLHAVEIARARFPDLTFLDSALESARESPFHRPADVLDAITALSEVGVEWREQKKTKGSGGDIRQKLIARGFGKRCSMHISDTTRTHYGTSYTFSYGGKRRLFEPHITLGSGDANSCSSIHFVLDDEAERIVIAHIGRHLPNTKK